MIIFPPIKEGVELCATFARTCSNVKTDITSFSVHFIDIVSLSTVSIAEAFLFYSAPKPPHVAEVVF